MNDSMGVKGNVTIGPDFFQKEIENYSRWQFAWGREVGQNSLDAGAKNIDITVKAEGDGCKVIWKDDGCGMTLKILLMAFLTLGASHKRKGATGGFGWAKTLILFAQTCYRILTNDIVLEGCGGNYVYTEGNPQVNGCIVEVVIPSSAGVISGHIKKWAKWTNTNGCRIKLNSGILDTFEDKKVLGEKPLEGIDWATMKMVKPAKEAVLSIFYRINGQMMSSTYTPDKVKSHVVIDITGDSTKYFTANRDQLKWCYRDRIDELLREMHRDPRSVTKVKEPTIITMNGKRGALEIGFNEADISKRLQFFLDNPDLLADMLQKKDSEGTVHDGFNTIIINDTDKNIPQKWMPGMWNKHAVGLMSRWIGICLLVGQTIGFKGAIVPGWYFSIGANAAWKGDIGAMVLNPVSIDEKTGRMTNRHKLDNKGFADLVVSSIHEFTHAMGNQYHNEDFIASCGEYTRKVIHNWAAFKALRKRI